MLDMPITQIFNSSIKLTHFLKDCKAEKLKPRIKKVLGQIPKHF